MPGGTPTILGPFTGGLHNASGRGEAIQDSELFDLTNFEIDPDDGSVVNRPGIDTVVNGLPASSITIGTFYPPGADPYVVTTNNTTIRIVNVKTGGIEFSQTTSGHAGTQFYGAAQDRFYVAPVAGKTDGGYFTFNGSAFAWTPIPAIPAGDVMVVYQTRLFLASGDQEPAKTDGTLYWSKATNGDLWDKPNDGGSAGISPGDGQRLKSIAVLNNDIILFKEHSTYRFTYTGNPLNASISKLSNVIGAPNWNSVAVYDNNSVFVIHGTSVWQLYAFNYVKISIPLRLEQILGPTNVNASLFQCLSICFSRLFLRYWNKMYVYNLDTRVWSIWKTTREFNRMIYCPAAANSGNPDVGFMCPAGNTATGSLQIFNDRYSHIVQNGGEVFTCTLQTKIFDFNEPWAYKVLFWWGLHIAAAGTVTANAQIPNAIRVVKWGDVATRTWGEGSAYKWGSSTKVVTPSSRGASSGEFGRRFIKNLGKMRFRQIYWTVTYVTQFNAENDAIIRVYSIVPVLKSKETVSRTAT
jgi:hypothetical protein